MKTSVPAAAAAAVAAAGGAADAAAVAAVDAATEALWARLTEMQQAYTGSGLSADTTVMRAAAALLATRTQIVAARNLQQAVDQLTVC